MSKTISVSQDSLDCILEMAGYGIAYWGLSATVDYEARTYTVIPEEHPTDEERTPIVIPFDKIIGAFWVIASPHEDVKFLPGYVRGYAMKAVADGFEDGQGDIDAGHVDSDLADAIIQVAAFGEVVFG